MAIFVSLHEVVMAARVCLGRAVTCMAVRMAREQRVNEVIILFSFNTSFCKTCENSVQY